LNILFTATRFDDQMDKKLKEKAVSAMMKKLSPELQDTYTNIASDMLVASIAWQSFDLTKLFEPLLQFVEHHLSIEFKDDPIVPIDPKKGLITAYIPHDEKDWPEKVRNFRERYLSSSLPSCMRLNT
jgi:hypothetical protein